MRCMGVHKVAKPAFLRGFLTLSCRVLHRLALAVVSEWNQEAEDYASPVPLYLKLCAPWRMNRILGPTLCPCLAMPIAR
jgi:hypothetical protein